MDLEFSLSDPNVNIYFDYLISQYNLTFNNILYTCLIVLKIKNPNDYHKIIYQKYDSSDIQRLSGFFISTAT